MNISEHLSDLVMVFLTKYGSLDNENEEIVRYGVEVFFASFIKLIIFLIIAFFLDLIIETIISIAVFGTLRHFAGGIHAKSPVSCLLSMFLIYSISISVAFFVEFEGLLFWLSSSFCLFAMLFYAPADTKSKPIVSSKQKKRLKKHSLALTTTMLGLALIIPQEHYRGIIVSSCILECITLLPITYKITNTDKKEVPM